MARNLKAANGSANSRRFPKGNQNVLKGNQISPVMRKVRSFLPAQKMAWQLHCMTEQPLSICQKLLSGHRVPNVEMMRALLSVRDKRFASEVLRAWLGEATPLAKGVAVKQRIEALEAELAALRTEAGQ